VRNNTNSATQSLRRTAMIFAGLVFFCMSIAAPVWSDAGRSNWDGPVLGMSFPPVQNRREIDFTITSLRALEIRHVRIAENWERRGMQPNRAAFGELKARIGLLQAAGLDVMLTVQADGPSEACETTGKHGCKLRSDAPFERYLELLLAEVGDDIGSIQFGNEWDHQFPGTAAEFLVLHQRFAAVVRQERPDLTIVLGGITNRAPYAHLVCSQGQDFGVENVDTDAFTASFCTRDAHINDRIMADISNMIQNADFDVFDVHLYDAPALWEGSITWLRSQLGEIPIWVTEFGGPHPELEPSDPEYQAKRLPDYMSAVKALQVQRAYYFRLTDDQVSFHNNSGLYDMKGRPKPALEVFRQALGL